MSLVLGKNPSNVLTPMEVDNSGNLKVDLAGSSGGAIAADVNIIADSVGLATNVAQAAGNISLSTLAGAVSGSEMQCDIISSALPSGAATSAAQSSTNANLASLVSANATETTLQAVNSDTTSIVSSQSNIDTSTSNIDSSTTSIDTSTQSIAADTLTIAGAVSGSEMQCDIISSALPSGAATEATLSAAEVHLGAIDTATSSIQSNVSTSSLQTTGNTTLSAISGKLPSALGQTTMSNSLAVVIASNQSSIPVSSAGGNTTNANQTLAPGANGTATSTAVDMNGFANVQFFGNSTNTSDQIFVQFSHNNSNFFVSPEHFVNFDFATGDYCITLADTAAQYVRITQTDTTTTAFTLQVNTSQK